MNAKPAFPWRLSIPGIGFVIALLPFLFEQWGNQQPWWNKMPWLEILLCIAGVFIGAIYADVTDDKSDLRAWWRSRGDMFEAKTMSVSRSDEKMEWFELTIQLRFTRAAIDVSVELFVYDSVQYTLTTPPKFICSFPKKNYSKDETLNVVVACVPSYPFGKQSERHTLWGGTPAGSLYSEGWHTISPASDNLAEVRATDAKQATQSFRVFMAMMERRAETRGLFFFIPETRDVSFRK